MQNLISFFHNKTVCLLCVLILYFWWIIGPLTDTLNTGNKSRDPFNSMDGCFADVSAAEISELLKVNSIEVTMIAISPLCFEIMLYEGILVARNLVLQFFLKAYVLVLHRTLTAFQMYCEPLYRLYCIVTAVLS